MKRNPLPVLCWLIALSLLAAAPNPARAAEASGEDKSAFMRFAEQDYLLGDWGGLRTDLSKHGVDFEFVYFGAVPMNVDGGIKRGAVYEGALMMTLDLNSEKLLGYKGGTLHVGGLSIHNGDKFSRNFIGDLNKVSLLDFPDTFRLWELWYEQKFFGDKLSFKFGQMAIDRDFIVPEYYNSLAFISLLNQTFFYPTLAFNVYDIAGFPPGDHALASTPYGAPGALVRFAPWQQFYVQAGAYDGNPDRGYSGTRVNLNENEGALIYYEAGIRLNQGKDDDGLEGNLKFGGFYHTDDFFDVDEAIFFAFGVTATPPSEHSGNWGFYFLADQQLYREKDKDDPAKQGLVGFFRVASAPSDRNLTDFGIDGGLVYRGLIPGRDWDSLAVAGSYLEISEDIKNAFRALGLPKADYEGVLEVSYRAQMTAWWTLQASVQRVFHPGARTDVTRPPIDDAWSIIFQTALRF